MANPTTNFGWVMPTSTSLVTNLPADFNTFGQAVDTSMAQLKGGTTGQILSKTSATDMAFTWITNDVGDITAVTAGTGISGGGTSGAVTVTNSMATAITSAGDLIKGTGSGTFDRLGIGSTGQVLTVSAGAPAWATPSTGSTFKGCVIKNSTNQSISNATYTYMNFDTELIDTDGFHSTSTNTDRITIPAGLAGKYMIVQQMRFDSNSTGFRRADIDLNASTSLAVATANGVNGVATVITATAIQNLSVGDIVRAEVYQTSGGALNATGDNGTGNSGNFLAVYYLGA